jgi:hypothetical protein
LVADLSILQLITSKLQSPCQTRGHDKIRDRKPQFENKLLLE